MATLEVRELATVLRNALKSNSSLNFANGDGNVITVDGEIDLIEMAEFVLSKMTEVTG